MDSLMPCGFHHGLKHIVYQYVFIVFVGLGTEGDHWYCHICKRRSVWLLRVTLAFSF
jgi:hypothetical protein